MIEVLVSFFFGNNYLVCEFSFLKDVWFMKLCNVNSFCNHFYIISFSLISKLYSNLMYF